MARTVLLVESNDDDFALTLRAFEHSEIRNEVVIVKGSVQAVDYINCAGEFGSRPQLNPALILITMANPTVDGLEVLRKIRESSLARCSPVVMFSSSGAQADIETAYNLGANGYVVKPQGFKELVHVLEVVCRFWTTHNQPLFSAGYHKTN